jgi:hypothetical protein
MRSAIHWLVGSACLLLVIGPACSKGNGASRPAATASSAPASRTTTAPAPGKYPSDELVAACAKKAEALRAKLDKTFQITVTPPFVVAGNLPAAEVEGYAKYTVLRSANALWASFIKTKPDQVIAVLLFSDEKSYRSWAQKLFNDTNVAFYGYYKPDERTLVMNISTGGGTLVHELTHALVVYDFPDQPQWFNEGLASLYEQCSIAEDRLIGLVNWRLKGLRDAMDAGKLRPLRELLTAEDFYGAKQGVNYAQARYFCQYMQEKGLLAKFYAYLRDNNNGDEASVKAVEHVFGRKIEEVEKDFLAWVKTLKFPR